MTVTNTLAYYFAESVTTVKTSTIHTHGDKHTGLQHRAINYDRKKFSGAEPLI